MSRIRREKQNESETPYPADQEKTVFKKEASTQFTKSMNIHTYLKNEINFVVVFNF